MPIRPENTMHSCTPSELFGLKTAASIHSLWRATGFNPLHSPEFWESWITVQLGGIKTDQKHPYDIEVEIGGVLYRVEVKYSRAFWSNYSPMRGKDYSRNVWKWAISKKEHREISADVVVMIGVDSDLSIYSYVIPRHALKKGRFITVTAASSRLGGPGRLDEWMVPPTEILPAVRSAGIQDRARAQRASGDLFKCEEVT